MAEKKTSKYILLTEKSWHDRLFDRLSKRKGEEWLRISHKEGFISDELQKFNPDKIFIPHWSYIIPVQIFEPYECIVFHMTDLPYGRGGSPLQNLIARGHKETKISAIRVDEGIDTGRVYLKESLSLFGSAEEIFLRSSKVIGRMIEKIIEQNPKPQEQKGEPVVFRRRKPSESNISELREVQKLFDHIRMLDCEGYPPAFLETDHFRLEFTRASLKADSSIIADVRIYKK